MPLTTRPETRSRDPPRLPVKLLQEGRKDHDVPRQQNCSLLLTYVLSSALTPPIIIQFICSSGMILSSMSIVIGFHHHSQLAAVTPNAKAECGQMICWCLSNGLNKGRQVAHSCGQPTEIQVPLFLGEASATPTKIHSQSRAPYAQTTRATNPLAESNEKFPVSNSPTWN